LEFRESRGFGFVKYDSLYDAEDAIDALDKTEYDGRQFFQFYN
jgi:RNA recognition motif-containing protein